MNIASRLTDDADSGHILTDKRMYNRLKLDFLFEPPTMLNIKGKGEMPAYRLKGRGDMQSHSDKSNVFQLPSNASNTSAL